jgi:hypothetical protein
MLWFEVCAVVAEFGWCMVSLSGFPRPKGGSRGEMPWFEVCALPAEFGSCMVSLSAFPFPKGGSLGSRLELEVCAIALAANAEANAAAKRNFFTMLSAVFRGRRTRQCAV